jgi:hypothetical protein
MRRVVMMNGYICERLVAQRVEQASRYWRRRAQTEPARANGPRRRWWWRRTPRAGDWRRPNGATAAERAVTVLP